MKDAFAVEAVVGTVKSTNHCFRALTTFRRLGDRFMPDWAASRKR